MIKKVLAAMIMVGFVIGQVGQAAALAAPTTADGFTQAFADKNDQTWSGGDQSTSYKAPNGKIYWLSGDTMVSNGEDPDGSYPDVGTGMVPNRILLQQGNEFVNAMANNELGVPNPSTRTDENQERYWPQAIIYENGYMYVIAQRVIRDPAPGSIGFKLLGSELAKYTVRSDGKLRFLRMVAMPSTNTPEIPGPAGIQWTGDMLRWGTHVYIYGSTLAPKDNPDWALHYGYVARVPAGQLENRSAWRYYKKSTNQWVDSTAKLATDNNNPDAIVGSQITSVRVIGSKVVMVHKPWNNWGSTVYIEVGARPEGGFTRYPILESPAGTWEGKNYHTYAPMLHPEQTLLGTETGKILVSINWNGDDFWSDVLGNADLGKPRFYAVSIPSAAR
jgi:hypothetical protein